MKPFIRHTGIAVPLRRASIDTDQIVSAAFLRRTSRTGYQDALFAKWRESESFVFNNAVYRGGGILVTGRDFGIGSSREHAVWALLDYGFRAVVSSGFGDIFATNASKQGLVTARCDEADVQRLLDLIESAPGMQVTIDLATKKVDAESQSFSFKIDDYTRWRLMEGLDDIGLTLRNEGDIAVFEKMRAGWMPATNSFPRQ